MNDIIKFWGNTGYYGYMSNFFFSPTVIDGVLYHTNEHFFQSKKFEGTKYEQYIIKLTTPAQTAKEGKRRDFPLRSDWESVKEEIMLKGLREKFKQNIQIQMKLIGTGDAQLIEDSPYDYYWGIGAKGTGRNRLGILLMQLREELRAE